MTEKMTAEQATTFEQAPSVPNMMILVAAAEERGCSCEPYTSWFTYRRWQAQGFQVQKGEHGTKITTWISYEDKQGKQQTRPKTTSVFCRCQVKPKETEQFTDYDGRRVTVSA